MSLSPEFYGFRFRVGWIVIKKYYYVFFWTQCRGNTMFMWTCTMQISWYMTMFIIHYNGSYIKVPSLTQSTTTMPARDESAVFSWIAVVWLKFSNFSLNWNQRTSVAFLLLSTIQKLRSVRFFLNKLILFFSQNALNCSKWQDLKRRLKPHSHQER